MALVVGNGEWLVVSEEGRGGRAPGSGELEAGALGRGGGASGPMSGRTGATAGGADNDHAKPSRCSSSGGIRETIASSVGDGWPASGLGLLAAGHWPLTAHCPLPTAHCPLPNGSCSRAVKFSRR